MNTMHRGWRLRRLGAVATLTALLALFAWVISLSGASAASKKPSITIGVVPGDVANLNPALNNAQFMDSIAYETLTPLRQSDGKVLPGLATSWRYVGRDNTVFEI